MIKLSTSWLTELTNIVGESNISTAARSLQKHSKDWSFHNPSMPDVVVWPSTAEEVSQILKVADKNNIPVTAWGGGSSLEGNPIPTRGGIVLDITKMDKILEVFENDLQVRVQPGIIGDELNEKLKKYNLFFPAAPGSSNIATIGGMIANNAGGMYAFKYGVVGDWVLELEIVLADGRIIRIGNRSLKSVSGYDLKRIFIGSEGTLGIITEAVLRLVTYPQTKIATMVSFEKMTDAVKTTLDIIKSDSNPAAVEYMDSVYMHYVNTAKNAKFQEKPTLIIEFHGDRDIVISQQKLVKKILKKNKNIFYKEYVTTEDLRLLWQYRRSVRPVLSKVLPNMGVLSAEVGVPVSQVASFLNKASKVSKTYGLETVMFGHIGEGNFHGWALNDDSSWKKAVKLNEELIKFAIGVGGTTTGEHGIGIGKRKFMSIEHSTSLPLMRGVKKLLDPKGILNPGKIFTD